MMQDELDDLDEELEKYKNAKPTLPPPTSQVFFCQFLACMLAAVYLVAAWLACSVTHSFACWLTQHSLTQSLTHSLTHSLYSLICLLTGISPSLLPAFLF